MSYASKDTIKVAVTGAAGQIAYSLLPNLVGVFGTKVKLQLLDIAPAMAALKGVAMELTDCAIPQLVGIIVTDDPAVAFKDADYAILLGAMPRKEGMLRSDLLRANVEIFKTQGSVLDNVAKKSVRVLVVGNPANTNALVCAHFAPSIPKNQFSALTRLDENRARALAAEKLSADIADIIVWGNHSNTQFPDTSHATANGKPFPPELFDFFSTEFIQKVSLRGAEIIAARKLSSAMSASKAICDHVRDWHSGTERIVSMAVFSDGSYNIPKGLIFSFPVRIDSEVHIVQNLKISQFAQSKLDATTKELLEERAEAFAAIGH